MTFLCGEQRVQAGPGTFVYGPREIPHGFRVEGTEPARMLLRTSRSHCIPSTFG